MTMQRTIRVLLKPTESQSAILHETMQQYAACYNHVAKIGFETHNTNGVALHHETYYPLREQFPNLPAQLVCSARVRATEALKSVRTLSKKGRKVSCPVMRHPAVRLDKHAYRLAQGTVGISSIVGRLPITFSGNPNADKWLSMSVGTASADLVLRNGRFYLHVVLNIPDKHVTPNGKVVGVDLGINRPAVTSDNKFHGERRWKEVDRRYFRLKRKLQAKGTKSAKKHLKRLSGKVQRFRRDCDHVISRNIVDSVEPGTVIAVEKLTGIRKNAKARGTANRRRLHRWSYDQLQMFLTYKGEDKGCMVVQGAPRHTSQGCSRCGHVAKSNRKSQSVFKCKQCGFELNADLNAARNIAGRYLVEDGKSVFDGPSSTGLLPQRLVS